MVGYRVAEGSAMLRGATLPGRVRLAMVTRAGEVLVPEQAGDLQAGDYAYLLAPRGQAPRLDWLFAAGSDARAAEQELFGSFTFAGNVPLGDIAQFYGLKIPARYSGRTASELFDERFDGQPQVGDRHPLGRAVLVVRSLADERVAQVGLRLPGMGERLMSDPRAPG
jgi:cell volume regulation protein A